MIRAAILASSVIAIAAGTAAQESAARERALVPYRLGFEDMRAEAFDEAAKAFSAATQTDPTFEMAYYMLGRANLAGKHFREAAAALSEAARLYRLQAGRQFSNAQEAQRYRREMMTEIDEYIRQLQSGRQTAQTAEQIRQLNERKRLLFNSLDRGKNMTLQLAVPSYVSLSLGSALFRQGKLAEAERAYVDAIAADPKAGEAHNNLAVVYMETGRYAEAEKAVKAAEQAGLKVQPALKEEIARRKKD